MKAKRLILYATSLAITSSAQLPTAGLVGGWTFSGNANDISGNGNNGTVTGASLIADRCGAPNCAYSFDGLGNYITMLTTGPTGTVSRSISFWAKSSYLDTSPIVGFDYGSSTGNYDACQIVFNYNCNGVGFDCSSEALIRSSSCLMNNKWHHIVAVYNASINTQINGVEFYVDAIIQPAINCYMTGTTGVINTGVQNPVTIGSQANGPNRFFDGALDDFYLYNRPLNYAEIKQLYSICLPSASGPSVVCSGGQYIYSVTPIAGATSYFWSLPSGWTGTSTTNTISTTAGANPGIILVSGMSSCGVVSSASKSVSKGVCPGITDIQAVGKDFLIYPNPGIADFVVDSKKAVEYTIVNSQGRCIKKGSLFPGKNDLTIEEPAGIYLLFLNDGESTKYLKVIKN